MPFEDDRLRVLQRVSDGEISPQDGQLEIAMLKVKYKGDDVPGESHAPDAEDGALGARRNPFFNWAQQGRPAAVPPSLGPMLMMLALPFLFLMSFIATVLAFVLALPAYVLVWFWNSQLVPAVAGAPALGFFTTLGCMVLATMLYVALAWRRRLKVFIRGAGGLG